MWIVKTRTAAEKFCEQGGEPNTNLKHISVLGGSQATMCRPGIFWHKSLIKLIWNQTFFLSQCGKRKAKEKAWWQKTNACLQVKRVRHLTEVRGKTSVIESRILNREANLVKEYSHWKNRVLFSLHHNLLIRMKYSNAIFNIDSNKVKINSHVSLLWCDISFSILSNNISQ